MDNRTRMPARAAFRGHGCPALPSRSNCDDANDPLTMQVQLRCALPGGTTMIRAWMRREHWLIWLTAIVVLTIVVATIGYFALAHLTVAVASTG